MKCPVCGSRMKTIDTRYNPDGPYVYRRRKCPNCRRRYATYETFEKPDNRVTDTLDIIEESFINMANQLKELNKKEID